jgi:hypothetical protein
MENAIKTVKNILASTVIATGLLSMASVADAAYFDFQNWIDVNGEQGFNNTNPFTLTDTGLILTATAYETPGMINSYVYMDASFNSIIGGMGVCSALTTNNQCANSSDDNVSLDGGNAEILLWNFSQSISQITLELGDSEHFDFVNSDFEYNTGTGWQTGTTDASASATLSLTDSSGDIEFRTVGADKTDYFYIRNADITVVPVPAALWLFGSGLLGLVAVSRRKA